MLFLDIYILNPKDAFPLLSSNIDTGAFTQSKSGMVLSGLICGWVTGISRAKGLRIPTLSGFSFRVLESTEIKGCLVKWLYGKCHWVSTKQNFTEWQVALKDFCKKPHLESNSTNASTSEQQKKMAEMMPLLQDKLFISYVRLKIITT